MKRSRNMRWTKSNQDSKQRKNRGEKRRKKGGNKSKLAKLERNALSKPIYMRIERDLALPNPRLGNYIWDENSGVAGKERRT